MAKLPDGKDSLQKEVCTSERHKMYPLPQAEGGLRMVRSSRGGQ